MDSEFSTIIQSVERHAGYILLFTYCRLLKRVACPSRQIVRHASAAIDMFRSKSPVIASLAQKVHWLKSPLSLVAVSDIPIVEPVAVAPTACQAQTVTRPSRCSMLMALSRLLVRSDVIVGK